MLQVGRYAKRSLPFDGAECAVYYPKALERRVRADFRPAAAHARGLRGRVRPVPVRALRGGRDARRARDPARGAGPRRVRRQPHRRPRRRGAAHRPRARPPVVRQQRRPRPLAGHLAQRGVLLLRRVAVVGCLGRRLGGPARPRSTTPASHACPRTSSSATPGPANMFDDRLYKRGALTLHGLRLVLGDEDFFSVLREWTTTHRHATATTADFIDLVATRTGHQVGTFFEAWLYRPELPPLPPLRRSARHRADRDTDETARDPSVDDPIGRGLAADTRDAARTTTEPGSTRRPRPSAFSTASARTHRRTADRGEPPSTAARSARRVGSWPATHVAAPRPRPPARPGARAPRPRAPRRRRP